MGFTLLLSNLLLIEGASSDNLILWELELLGALPVVHPLADVTSSVNGGVLLLVAESHELLFEVLVHPLERSKLGHHQLDLGP